MAGPHFVPQAIRVCDVGGGHSCSSKDLFAELSMDGNTQLGTELGRRDLLAVVIPDFQHFDVSPVGRDEHTVPDVGDGSHLAADLGYSPCWMFADVEQLQLPALEQGPRARGGIAAANQV